MKIAFFYSGLPVSLSSTASVARLVAEHALTFSEAGMQVAILSPEADNIQNCPHVPIAALSAIRYKYLWVKWKIFKKRYPSTLNFESVKKKLAPFNEDWVFVVPKYGDLPMLRSCKPSNSIFLWMHHCPSQLEVDIIFKNKLMDGIVLPTLALYKKIADMTMIKGCYAPAFIIRYLHNPHFRVDQKSLSNTGEAIKIVHLGGDNGKKGILVVLAALQLLNTDKHIEFHSFGHSGTFQTSISATVTYHQKAKIGREKVKAELSNCDIGLVPSLWFENSPTAMLEMMSSGIAVIASKVGGIPEVLGDAGLLVENPNMSFEWSRAIEYLIDNESERRKLGKMGTERVVKMFCKEEILAQWTRIFSLKNVTA